MVPVTMPFNSVGLTRFFAISRLHKRSLICRMSYAVYDYKFLEELQTVVKTGNGLYQAAKAKMVHGRQVPGNKTKVEFWMGVAYDDQPELRTIIKHRSLLNHVLAQQIRVGGSVMDDYQSLAVIH